MSQLTPHSQFRTSGPSPHHPRIAECPVTIIPSRRTDAKQDGRCAYLRKCRVTGSTGRGPQLRFIYPGISTPPNGRCLSRGSNRLAAGGKSWLGPQLIVFLFRCRLSISGFLLRPTLLPQQIQIDSIGIVLRASQHDSRQLTNAGAHERRL